MTLGDGRAACRRRLTYATDLFDAATIERLVGHLLESLLGGAAADPERPVAELPLLDAGRARQLLVEWNGRRPRCRRSAIAHELFEAQVGAIAAARWRWSAAGSA